MGGSKKTLNEMPSSPSRPASAGCRKNGAGRRGAAGRVTQLAPRSNADLVRSTAATHMRKHTKRALASHSPKALWPLQAAPAPRRQNSVPWAHPGPAATWPHQGSREPAGAGLALAAFLLLLLGKPPAGLDFPSPGRRLTGGLPCRRLRGSRCRCRRRCRRPGRVRRGRAAPASSAALCSHSLLLLRIAARDPPLLLRRSLLPARTLARPPPLSRLSRGRHALLRAHRCRRLLRLLLRGRSLRGPWRRRESMAGAVGRGAVGLGGVRGRGVKGAQGVGPVAHNHRAPASTAQQRAGAA